MQISIFDQCTCGSGIAVNNCCFKEIITMPPVPKTNYSHPKCYARSLGDCSSKISKEHFLSKCVQDLFGGEARVKTPFLGEEGKLLKLASLSSNVLCVRHNNALSPLDDLARRYFEFALGRTKHEFLVIRGTDLERWLLKLMCGIIATGYGQTPSGTLITGLEPPLAALATLFGSLELPENWGLVIPKKAGIDLHDKLHFVVLADENRACGCAVTFSYIQLMFFLQPSPKLPDKSIRLYQRPGSIGYTVDGLYREVHFGWPDGDHVSLSFSSEKKAQG
jgi:hypothetical protein